MPKVALQGGAYSSRSLLASAQRCVGLYAEKNPPDAVFPFTYYPMPGLTRMASPPTAGEGRGLFRMSDGRVYSVVGSNVYEIAANYSHFLAGTIKTATGLVSMRDNGISTVLVDGSAAGYVIGFFQSATVVPITAGDSEAFYGANRVDYLDTFFLFNRPNTNQFYISASEASTGDLLGGPIVAGVISNAGSGYTDGTYSSASLTNGYGDATADIVVSGGAVASVTIITPGSGYRVGEQATAPVLPNGSDFAYQISEVGSSAFDQLDIAAKAGSPDAIMTLIVMHGELWLIGRYTTEVWYDSGAADFAFQRMPGVFIEHGTCATNSVARQDLTICWLSQDPEGQRLVLAGANYAVSTISTRALEAELATYVRVDDAIGWTWQQNGQTYYQLTFPSAYQDEYGASIGRTWLYNFSTETWCERPSIDSDGVEQRWRVHTGCLFNGQVIGQDWQTGDLYKIDSQSFTDNGAPIKRLRSWAHIADSGQRLSFSRFQLAMEAGGIGTGVGDIQIASGGSGYTSAPAVTISGGGGRNATATSKLSYSLSGLTLTASGSGYTSAPTVVITGGDGSGATAVATIASVVSAVSLTAGGTNYTSAPAVNFIGGGGSGASATAKVSLSVTSVSTTHGGSGYSTPPVVAFSGDGSGAAATAALAGGLVSSLTLTNAGSGYTSAPSVSITGGGGSGATAVAMSGGGGVTAINVTAAGSYTSAPTVVISSDSGQGASATANLSGSVISITVDEAGGPYGSPPNVAISGGGGSGATANAVITSGKLTSVTVTNAGSGYTSAPGVALSGGQSKNTTEFEQGDAYANLGGSVASVTVTNPGSGYASPPTINFSGGSGSGAAATSTVGSSSIVARLTNGGSGYTSTPNVSFSGGGGSGAAAVTTISSPVGAITVTSGGSGYSTPPNVVFNGGGGSGATATAAGAGPVTSVAVTNPGAGYAPAPAVAFTGGGGTGAAATAVFATGVNSLTLTNPGTGYDYPPAISFSGGGGAGTAAIATVIGQVSEIDIVNPGSGYTSPPNVVVDGGATAYASLYQKDAAQVALRWSDTQGRTYGNALTRQFGPEGAYQTSLLWTRLGMGRDRVFEVSWSAPVETALLGAYIEVAPSGT